LWVKLLVSDIFVSLFTVKHKKILQYCSEHLLCILMLCNNNVCLQFTDIIRCEVAGEVSPVLTGAHHHAVIVTAPRLTRVPICIVHCCPIAPLPGSLIQATVHSRG
jgi:hypothetical protein